MTLGRDDLSVCTGGLRANIDEVRSGKHLACSGHYMSPIAKGEPVTDMADDQEGSVI